MGAFSGRVLFGPEAFPFGRVLAVRWLLLGHAEWNAQIISGRCDPVQKARADEPFAASVSQLFRLAQGGCGLVGVHAKSNRKSLSI